MDISCRLRYVFAPIEMLLKGIRGTRIMHLDRIRIQSARFVRSDRRLMDVLCDWVVPMEMPGTPGTPS